MCLTFGYSNLCIYWPLDFRKFWHSEGPSCLKLRWQEFMSQYDMTFLSWWRQHVLQMLYDEWRECFSWWTPELCLPYSICHNTPYHPVGAILSIATDQYHPWSYLYRLWKGWILFKNPWFHRVCSWSHYVQWIDYVGTSYWFPEKVT